jgi:hypothetical protein
MEASHSSRLKHMSRHSNPMSSKNSEVPLMIPVTRLSSKTPKPPADCANSKNSAERREEVSGSAKTGATVFTPSGVAEAVFGVSVRLRNLLSIL